MSAASSTFKAPKGESGSVYSEDIASLLDLLGGKENIASALHCVSRLRLVLVDPSKVDDKAIGRLKSTKGTIKLPGNQYHVVIGVDVPNYFAEFQRQTGVKEASTTEFKSTSSKKGGKVQWVMQNFSEIFIPLIPVLVAAGLILGVRNIFEANFNGFVMTQWSPVIKGLNDFLWIPAQAGLWFLPVYICWSVFKKMGGSQAIAILVGLSMLINPLQNVYAIAGQASGPQWIWNLDLSKIGFDFGAWKFPWQISYTAQVIPALGVAFAAVYIERWLNRWTNPVIKQIVVPVVTVLVAYVLAMCVIGPVGWIIGTAISYAFSWALTNGIARYIFAPIFGFLYAPLVVTGLHHMLNAVMAQDVGQLGGTILFPILCMSNIAQGAAALAVGISQRKNAKVRSLTSSACVSAWLGVTEPAMYGVNIRFGAPFLAAITGSALGCLLAVAMGVSSAGIGNGGWLGVLSIQSSSPIAGLDTVASAGQAWFILAALLVTGVTIALVFVFRHLPRFKKLERANAIDDDPEAAKSVVKRDGLDVAVRWAPALIGMVMLGLATAVLANPTFGANVANGLTDSTWKHASFAFITAAITGILSLPMMALPAFYGMYLKRRGPLDKLSKIAILTVAVALLVLLVAAVAFGYSVTPN